MFVLLIALAFSQDFFSLGRAFHHYREASDQGVRLKKHPELDRLLREEYRRLDDFKAKNAIIKEDKAWIFGGERILI